MTQLTRKSLIFVAALTLAVIFLLSASQARRVCATCGSTIHTVNSEHTDRQVSDTKDGVTTNTEETSTHTVIIGDLGDVFTEDSTYNKNADGSSESHEHMHNEDPNGCYDDDGEAWKGDVSIDITTDAKGNRKQHTEEIIEKNGKCMKHVHDMEWDSKGTKIKDKEYDVEVPCTAYNLEYTFEGSLDNSQGTTMQFGPDTAVIPLALNNGVYEGFYKGDFHAAYSGKCSGSHIYPTQIDVKAKEDDFGDLEVTMTETRSDTGAIVCPEGQAPISGEPTSNSWTFTIKAEDGATYAESAAGFKFTYKLTKTR